MKTDFRIVELNESRYWKEDFLKEICCGKVYGVYIFDKNQITCLCSPQPNYWLRVRKNIEIYLYLQFEIFMISGQTPIPSISLVFYLLTVEIAYI